MWGELGWPEGPLPLQKTRGGWVDPQEEPSHNKQPGWKCHWSLCKRRKWTSKTSFLSLTSQKLFAMRGPVDLCTLLKFPWLLATSSKSITTILLYFRNLDFVQMVTSMLFQHCVQLSFNYFAVKTLSTNIVMNLFHTLISSLQSYLNFLPKHSCHKTVFLSNKLILVYTEIPCFI